MRRAVPFILLVVVACFVPGVAGIENFDTVLYTDELTEDFEVSGWAVGRIAVDTVTIDMEYSMELVNDAYNTTDVAMDVLLTNESGTMAAESFDFTLERNDTHTDDFRITATASPAQIDRVEFRANHTATLADGQTTDRSVQGGFDIEVVPGDQEIEWVNADPVDVYRGTNATYVVSTSNIAEITVNNESLEQGEAGRFHGEIRVPSTLPAGNETWPVNLTTGRGTVFLQEVEVRVLNNPPSVSVNVPDEAQVGVDVPVQVDVSDDRTVADTTVTFQNETVSGDGGTYALPTSSLSAGTYQFNVSATDNDGAMEWTSGTVTVAENPDQSTDGNGETNGGSNGGPGNQQNGQQEGNGDQQYSENTSFLISVVNGIRGLFESLLFG